MVFWLRLNPQESHHSPPVCELWLCGGCSPCVIWRPRRESCPTSGSPFLSDRHSRPHDAARHFRPTLAGVLVAPATPEEVGPSSAGVALLLPLAPRHTAKPHALQFGVEVCEARLL